MKKITALIVSLILVLCLLAACGGNAPSGNVPANTQNSAGQNQENNTNTNSNTKPAAPADVAPAPSVNLRFETAAYLDPSVNDTYNALAYASNSGNKTARVTVKYRALDKDGNVIKFFDQFKGSYREDSTATIYVPAGAKDLPIGFALPTGYAYDYSTGKEVPPMDHMDFEVTKIEDEEFKDLKEHFTPGGPTVKENHIYIYVKFDQEIGDNYKSIYANYTLLGYSNRVLTTVCCRNDYPLGSSSFPVDYAKEKNDSSILVYHSIPREPVDKWELHLGCIGAR